MTEIPEHLLKRAQAAREKAAEPAAEASAPAEEADPAASDSRIPAHLLQRSKSAKSRSESGPEASGGGVAVADRAAEAVAAAPVGGSAQIDFAAVVLVLLLSFVLLALGW